MTDSLPLIVYEVQQKTLTCACTHTCTHTPTCRKIINDGYDDDHDEYDSIVKYLLSLTSEHITWRKIVCPDLSGEQKTMLY